jgi:omega-amidase
MCQFRVGDDASENRLRAKQLIDASKIEHGADLAVLSEIWNSPYATSAFPDYAEVLPSLGDSYHALDPITQPSSHLLGTLARQHRLWLVGGSIPEVVFDGTVVRSKPLYYNTCLVFNPEGVVVAKHRKAHLFDIDVPGKIRFMESDTLSAGNAITSFDSPWCTIGIGICYDIRFAEYSHVLAKKRGAKVLIFPGAFNLTTGPLHWELLQRGRAVDNQCWVLTASPARSTPDDDKTRGSKYPPYFAWGHSSAVDPWGNVVATTDENESIVIVDVDLAAVDDMRTSIPIRNQIRTDLYTTSTDA